MRNHILVLSLWTLLELLTSSYALYGDFAFPRDPSVVYTYSRSAEIDHQCSPFLFSASELKSDNCRGEKLKNELTFYHGDWWQEYTGASLMPFNDRDMPGGDPSLISPWKVVSFEVTDVNSVHQSKTTVRLSGVLSIGITRNSTFLKEPISPFIMRPGMSALRVNVEGVYFETEENGGERLICLLGNATLPSRKSSDDSTDMMSNYFDAAFDTDPMVSQSGQILLLLRYPRTFNLSSRKIRGEMTSLTKDDFSTYFDKVHISSQLGSFSKYQFSSRNLSPRSYDPYLLHNKLLEDGVCTFSSCEFCRILKRFQDESYHILPKWKLGGEYDEHQNEFGPFLLANEINAIGSSYKNLRINMQNIICEKDSSQGETKNARVAAVLRLSTATIEPYVAGRRTGLSKLTLSVEGTWNSSLGQLRMVGCRGPELAQCDTQILLYFPRLISINQKNMIVGSLSSINNEIGSYTPILFGFGITSVLFRHNWYIRSYLSYDYSKIDQAIAFRERSQPGTLIASVKQSLLRYPSLGDGGDLLDRLDLFSGDLRFRSVLGPETSIQLEVLSIGPLLSPLGLPGYSNNTSVGTHPEISKSDILNISLILMFTEAPVKVKDKCYNHVSNLRLEGLYVPLVGTLYLVGCRNVLMQGRDIEGGLDCLIEVKVEYSSETTRWLINPTAKIIIASQRSEKDPLFFTPVTLQTFRLHARNHENSANLRKNFEGGLRVVLLLVSVALIWSQLRYMKKNADLVPYISLVMLCIQLFGYGSSLICDKEILIKSRETKYYRDQMYNLRNYELFVKGPGYSDKLLVLAALILTARVFQLVLRARAALRAQGGSKFGNGNVPSEMRVLLIYLAVFVVFSLFSLLDYWYLIPPGEDIVSKVVFMISKFFNQVFSSPANFLAPQLIATYLSKSRVNPLRKAYFIGFLLISFLQISYDHVQDLSRI